MPPQGKTVLELPWRLSFPPLLRSRFRPRYAKPTKQSYPRALHLLHYPSAPAASTLTPPPPHHRPFTTTCPLLKKGGKEKRNTDTSPNSTNPSTGAAAAADNIDPFDTSGLETSIQKAIAKLKDDLSKLRVGGQFNPEVLEGLRVQVGGKGGKGSGESGVSVRLGEVAQVLPRRGRSVVVVVAEKEHLKPILTSLLTSPYSLSPSLSDAQNEMHITVPIPPPTRTNRLERMRTVTKAGEQAGAAVRAARAVMQKRLRGMGVARSVRPDDLRRAGEGMEKVVERAVGDVKEVVEGARTVVIVGA